MNLNIVGKQFELTDAIKDYITNCVASLEKYNLNIISTKITISADEAKGKKGFLVDLLLNLAKKNTIIISYKDKDLYNAIDVLISKASKTLRREHDKNITHKNKDELKDRLNIKLNELDKEKVDMIIPTELETYKPLDVSDALKLLKSSKDIFLVFHDLDAKLRVLYKRKDGNFGIF